MFKAKSIVDNKFWILENEEGSPVGTIKILGKNVRVILGNRQQDYANITQAQDELDLKFIPMADEEVIGDEIDETEEETLNSRNEVYDFPTKTEPRNALWNVKLKLPIYTKTGKSNSYHCAGYYIVRFPTGWVKSYCPKLVTLEQYDYRGPYKSRAEMIAVLRNIDEPT